MSPDQEKARGKNPWGRLIGKIHRSPRTLENLLQPSIERKTLAIQKLVRRGHFAQTSTALRRRNPNAEGIVLNTRMVDSMIPSIAHWADWRLTKYGFSGNLRKQPQTIYVKAISGCLHLFIERYLPLVHETSRFVLITGDADTTVPRQVDRRYPDYLRSGLQERLLELLDDPRLLHWYAENLDTPLVGITPIPLGYINRNGNILYSQALKEPPAIPIRQRTLKAFCAHRVREGHQWERRKQVTTLATTTWNDFVDFRTGIPYADFFPTLQTYPFVICVGGGGLDPSPKAWTALLAGAIPIIERNPTTTAYVDLPVAFVDSWTSDSLDRNQLRTWLEQLHPHFEDPVLRRSVLEKMSMASWLKRIRSHHEGGRP